jgi:hypothetical protein
MAKEYLQIITHSGNLGNNYVKRCKGRSCNECGKYDPDEQEIEVLDHVQPLLLNEGENPKSENVWTSDELRQLQDTADSQNILLPSSSMNVTLTRKVQEADGTETIEPLLPNL